MKTVISMRLMTYPPALPKWEGSLISDGFADFPKQYAFSSSISLSPLGETGERLCDESISVCPVMRCFLARIIPPGAPSIEEQVISVAGYNSSTTWIVEELFSANMLLRVCLRAVSHPNWSRVRYVRAKSSPSIPMTSLFQVSCCFTSSKGSHCMWSWEKTNAMERVMSSQPTNPTSNYGTTILERGGRNEMCNL